ncbi:hypothetical protein AAFC00_000783 [Neodothiora populina]|uniref:Pectinesterase n=1 Tax=Neodothiora populina TaxID=2781224 RepID=A0ABR3PLV8_9PEZI
MLLSTGGSRGFSFALLLSIFLDLSFLASTVYCVLSEARTTPPSGAIVVDSSASSHGSSTVYATIQEGVNALSTTETGDQYLFIYPGVYKEQVYIAPRKANLTIQGYTEDASSWVANRVNVTYNLALQDTTTDDLTATVRIWAENVKVYNLNILNTFGHTNSNGQNLALSAQAANQGYYGVGLYSYQDTLLAETGAQIYSVCQIQGAIDFIFGQHAQAWLHNISIVTIAAGSITASGRASADDASWYIIDGSSIHGINASVEAQTGLNYLGRPWRDYARVTIQNTYLSPVVNTKGWNIWNSGDERTDHVQFEEFGNTGPGSYPTDGKARASFSSQLTKPRTIEEIIGDRYEREWYVDAEYLS